MNFRAWRKPSALLTLCALMLPRAAMAAASPSIDDHTPDRFLFGLAALLAVGLITAYLWINRRRSQNHAGKLTKLAEDLRQSEQRYRSLVERVPAVIYMLSADGKIASLNPAFEATTGWPVEEWLGKPFVGLIHPEDAGRATQVFQRVLRGEQPPPYVLRVRNRLGEYLTVEIITTPRVEGGEVIGSLGVARDLFERQRAEEALRKSEEHYRSLVENINDMYYVSDRNGRLTYGSPNLFSKTGYAAEELMGRSYTRLIAPQDRRRVVDFYLRCAADGTVDTTCTFLARNRAGEMGWVEQATRIIRDAGGEVVEYRNLVRDIRERKGAEERIHMLAHAIRSTSECVTITDRNNHILFVNDAFLRTYGYEAEELIGRHIAIVRSPNCPPASYDPILPGTLGDGWQGELLNRRKDGTEFLIALSTSVVRDEDGEPIALVGVARDITERKKTEARTAALSNLGRRLSSATTAKEAAGIIVEIADDLLGWDACALALYVSEQDVIESLLSIDLIEGKRREVTLGSAGEPPSSLLREVINEGPRLILREQPASEPAILIPFGDVSRPSMSLMFAPLRDRANVTGVLTIQSYTLHAYDEEDLKTLQALADHCGGALDRVSAEQRRQRAEEQYREIFENAAEGLYRSSPDRKFITANPAVAQILGYDSPQELIDSITDIREQIIVDGVGASREFRHQLDTHGIVHGLETQFFRKDGSRIWVSSNARPTFDAEGKLLFYDCFLEDISERKRAEDALRESEARFATAFHANPAALAISTLADGRYVDVNDSYVQLTGHRREDLIGRTSREMGTWVDYAERANLVKRLQELRSLRSQDMELRNQSGELRIVIVSMELIEVRGEPCILGMTYDITERKRAEEALQESEDRYRSIVEGTHALLFSTDLRGRLTYVNEAAARALGCPAQQLLGSFYLHFVHPDDRERVHALFAQQIAEANPNSYTEFRYCLDSREGWLSFLVNPILDHEKVVGLTGVSQDITTRKLAEQAAQQELSRISLLNEITRAIAERQEMKTIFGVVLQHLEDHMPIDFGAIFLHDAETDQLTVAARGPRSQEIAHLLGRPDSFPVDDTGLRDCLRGEVRYLSDLTDLEFPQAQDLVRHGMHATVAIPLRSEDKVFGILGVARREIDGFSPEDLGFLRMLSDHVALAAYQARLQSELRDAYDELRQTQQAAMQQERLRALGQMASGIAHDLNNALSPVVGFAELLLDNETNLTERARRYLQHIRTAGTDIAHIVARMREFYRQREERASLVNANLNALARQVIEFTVPRWKDMAHERGAVIEMQTHFDNEVPVIQGIESEIREALTNLIFNAVDAMPGGGTITVRTIARRNKFSAAPTVVVLQVADTGIGMDDETRRRCLEPFFSTKGERGTGLGLAMVYGVMQRHDGTIDIESRLGLGTTVELTFPVQAAADTATHDGGRGGTVTSRSLRILMVDDEPALRELLQEMLAADGHETATAENGRAAMAAFREARERNEPFDLVITDLGMPEMDGRQLARSVKRESPETAVIMVTGWGTRLHAEEDIPQEVDVVLNKPPRLAELRAALAEVQSRQHPPTNGT